MSAPTATPITTARADLEHAAAARLRAEHTLTSTRAELDASAYRAYMAGMSTPQIAAVLGVAHVTVLRMLSRHTAALQDRGVLAPTTHLSARSLRAHAPVPDQNHSH